MKKTVTIPKELAKTGNLVIISREEYEEFLLLKKIIPLVKPSSGEKKAIRQGRGGIKKSKREKIVLEKEKLNQENSELKKAIEAILSGELSLKRGQTRDFRQFLKSKFPEYAKNF